jgi:bacteriocin-like protein
MSTEDATKSDVLEQKIQETEKVESETVSEDQLKSISGGIIAPGGGSDGGTCVF